MDTGVASRTARIFHHSAGAIVVERGRCLLIRRGTEWAFPKGHLEEGESAEEAARREVAEETGIEIELLAPLGSTTYDFKGKGGSRNRKRVDWFLARRVGGEIRHEPIFSEARFTPLEEALRILTHEADRGLLEKAIAKIREGSRTE